MNPQKEILNNENASVADQHGVLATLAKAGEFLTDPSSASTWLGRTTQDVVGSFLGSTGLGASDSNGFIDKNTGKYVQRTCFTAGTLIRTKSGLKPIEKIEIGDLVLSLDPKTGELSYKKVLRLFSNETPIVHRITYTNGNVINTTWNHPFFIRGKGFTEVRNIQPEERSVTVASIRNSYRIERGSGIQIGASLASLGSRSTNSNSATWKDEIRGTVGIAKIEEVYEKTKVYNFEVEENHTYFVGKDGVLVHNDASCGPGYVAGLKEAVAANGGELLGGKTLEERKAETALLREQAPNKKEFDAFYETGKTHVEVGKEAALWYSGERVLQLGVKGLIRGTEMFLGTEAGIKIASKVKGWFGAGEEVASVVSKEFATNANQAVFWSGVRNGQTAAGEWAAKNGGITLEQTLSNRGINLPTWDANNPAAIEAWRQASKKFAEGASGNVRVIQGDAVRTKSIWTEVEFPALKTNPKVNSIIAVHPDTGFETVLWTR
ncbi:intein C-terminal splicing domain protein [Leptospira broomii serovar Hurstbridge str. 5399]|uniref:Intein C-terminal splicing domain protein n=1 Tax=Leptospira broomii serovar Hurstbridge str. 5399 TaxID=1049789 RepID=T0F6N0_9LEPT|nr:intein C-terminal splicing domain protein [Leptospira broomii serovar Hurstbridge str. 5399]